MKTHNGILLVSSLVSVFAVGASGCAVDDDAADDIEVRTDAVSISPAATSSGIQYGTMYTWARNGRTYVPLIQGANNACFLNSVWGKFHNGTGGIPDEVAVFQQFDGQWAISGFATQDGSPGADAFCIRNVTPTADVYAESGDSKPMGVNPATHSCFFTMIGGAFNTASSYARLRKTDSDWLLEVSSAGGFKRVLAQCVPKPPGPELTVSALGQEVQMRAVTVVGSLPPLVSDATNPSVDQPFFCALTKVQGFLSGPDSRWVGTYLKPMANGAFAWKLGRGPNFTPFANELSASARCVR